jgi:hypothetical protein
MKAYYILIDVVKAINDIVNSVFRLVIFSFLKASFVSLGNVPPLFPSQSVGFPQTTLPVVLGVLETAVHTFPLGLPDLCK